MIKLTFFSSLGAVHNWCHALGGAVGAGGLGKRRSGRKKSLFNSCFRDTWLRQEKQVLTTKNQRRKLFIVVISQLTS